MYKCQGLRGGAPHKMPLCVAQKAYLAIPLGSVWDRVRPPGIGGTTSAEMQ